MLRRWSVLNRSRNHKLSFNVLQHLTIYLRAATIWSDARRILTAVPQSEWRRPVGRPYTSWMATLKNDLARHNLALEDAIELALNKPLWRLLAASGDTHWWCMPNNDEWWCNYTQKWNKLQEERSKPAAHSPSLLLHRRSVSCSLHDQISSSQVPSPPEYETIRQPVQRSRYHPSTTLNRFRRTNFKHACEKKCACLTIVNTSKKISIVFFEATYLDKY